MTDDKKGPDDLGEVDWDSALSDWESKTFVPEVAKDVVTDKPAALSGQTVSRPLYRPPPVVAAAGRRRRRRRVAARFRRSSRRTTTTEQRARR